MKFGFNIQGTDAVEWIGNNNYDNWLSRPAKKDIFDKLIDYVDKKLFGIEPRKKTQADQFFSGCFFGLQLDQQQAVNEFSETMTSTMKNAASYDLEIESESFPVNSIPAMPSNRVNSTGGSGKTNFEPPKVYKDAKWQITNDTHTIDSAGMEKHNNATPGKANSCMRWMLRKLFLMQQHMQMNTICGERVLETPWILQIKQKFLL